MSAALAAQKVRHAVSKVVAFVFNFLFYSISVGISCRLSLVPDEYNIKLEKIVIYGGNVYHT